ncbi:DUF6951 family protein [Chloroflexota bacterium]
MTRVTVNPGVCGMVSTITVSKKDRWQVNLKIDSKCEMIIKIGEELAEMDMRDAMKPQSESSVYKCASKVRSHTACPVPMAILKAMEVEAGMALPRPVSLTFEPVNREK